MNLPMPNDEFDGGIVVASCYTIDNDDLVQFVLLLLMPEAPFYAVSVYENSKHVDSDVFKNIVFAADFYQEVTGCV